MNYLYNGVELSALPQRDEESYPNALIMGDRALAHLIYSSKPLYVKAGIVYDLYPKADCVTITYRFYELDGDYWAMVGDEGQAETADGKLDLSFRKPLWANYDLLKYDDDSLYLAASDPIPVTTAAPIDPTSFMQGWLVGRRIAAMRGKKTPVAYLYNGVRLPKLPEWDTVAYPYAVISYENAYGLGNRTLYCFSEQKELTYREDIGAWSFNTPTGYMYLRSKYGIIANDANEAETLMQETPFDVPSERNNSVVDKSNWVCTVGDTASNLLWANYPVYDSNGKLRLPASDPVPVYE